MSRHLKLVDEIERLAVPGSRPDVVMQHISDRLHGELVRYNWVGFYLAEPNDPNYMLLGPHSGVFTPHIRVSLHEGIRGAAASLGKTVAVNDVRQDSRYLMGVEETQSEIVAPILIYGSAVAELNISSFFKDTWDAEETAFVERCAAVVRRCM
jgi:L-methionine (R)-S-oxide reductase